MQLDTGQSYILLISVYSFIIPFSSLLLFVDSYPNQEKLGNPCRRSFCGIRATMSWNAQTPPHSKNRRRFVNTTSTDVTIL